MTAFVKVCQLFFFIFETILNDFPCGYSQIFNLITKVNISLLNCSIFEIISNFFFDTNGNLSSLPGLNILNSISQNGELKRSIFSFEDFYIIPKN